MSERKPLVWIVDDSPTEAALTERALGSGFAFEKFMDGAIVVERISATERLPDVLLLDWVMPGMTGDQVCRFLRSRPQTMELPILLVTASRVDTADIVAGLASGANDYVPRPFPPEELRARVHAALRTKQLSDLAKRERRRLETINRLGHAFLHGLTSSNAFVEELARTLIGAGLCDGCAVVLLPGDGPEVAITRHRYEAAAAALAPIGTLADPAVHTFGSSEEARAKLPPVYRSYIERFGLRGLAILPFPTRDPLRGVVTVTRERDSEPFEPEDIATIETCIEYTSLAVERLLRQQTESAVAAERDRVSRFLEDMLAIVGHDLRSPLGAVLTASELLADELPDSTTPGQTVRRIQNSVDRMTRIIEQLLDVTQARLGAGLPIAAERTSLAPIVHSVLEELRLAYPKTPFVLRGSADVHGTWDADRLAQAFSNLASNAAQYGPPGAPVTLEVTRDATRAFITVHNALRDNPIPPEVIASLFEPYRRGSAVGHRKGLGLGLYIVQAIVRAHRGTISVESDARGTTFTVALPFD